jgi:hypothetical protein
MYPPDARRGSLRRALARPHDVLRAAHALAWMVAARVMLATVKFNVARKVLRYRSLTGVDRTPLRPPHMEPGAARALQIAERVLDMPSLGVTCVPRSIAIERICVANGVPAELVIGIDRSEGFRAHAWVEVHGYALGAKEAGRAQWTALGRFRSPRAERLGAR